MPLNHLLRRNPLNLFFVVFLLTAGMGVWASYNPVAAWSKFWIIVGAIAVYYLIASRPRTQWVSVLVGSSLLGAGLSLYFLFTHDWQQNPADLGIINRLGVAWMFIRPTAPGPQIHPNIAGGILAMLIPLHIVLILAFWQSHKIARVVFSSFLAAVAVLGLFFTSSRAAWLALGAGMMVWGWWIAAGFLAHKLPQRKLFVFGIPLLVAGTLTLIIVGVQFNKFVRLADSLPGYADATSRAEIARNTWQLIREVPFTGGGLAAFPGLYATYMRGIRVFEFAYAHNWYLDVALEQGFFGFLALLIILLGSGWMLAKSLEREPSASGLPIAALVSLVIIVLHGFVDDSLYGMGGTALVFLIPGLATSVWLAEAASGLAAKTNTHRKIILVGAAFTGIALLFGVIAPQTQSILLSNIGVLNLARLQLRDWPEHLVEGDELFAQTATAEAALNQAIKKDATNFTAHYHLGLLAFYANDFETAAQHLQAAYTSNPHHRGIRKSLGYTYVWLNQLDQAEILLPPIAEAAGEMGTYAWWWGTQNETDLAARAAEMAQRLER
jgi:O-antigen ligase